MFCVVMSLHSADQDVKKYYYTMNFTMHSDYCQACIGKKPSRHSLFLIKFLSSLIHIKEIQNRITPPGKADCTVVPTAMYVGKRQQYFVRTICIKVVYETKKNPKKTQNNLNTAVILTDMRRS